jgi:ribosomal protein L34E
MAVRVIKTVPAKEVVQEVICRNCSATLEYTPNDVHRCSGTDLTLCRNYKWVDCPNCNKQAIIDSGDLIVHLRQPDGLC